VDTIVDDVGPVDWSDARAAHASAARILDRVGTGGLLADLVVGVVASSGAGGGCESYPYMDKLLLWQSPDRQVRLRLHVFSPGYRDRPHNHRWNFQSRLIGGRYLHAVYGSEAEVLRQAQAGEVPPVRHVHEETAGTQYFLEHSLVHSLRADTRTASLVLRGPAEKDDYFTLELPGPEDAPGGVRVLWSTGAARESSADQAAKAMTGDGFTRVVEALRSFGVG